jgi:hypothetical protein
MASEPTGRNSCSAGSQFAAFGSFGIMLTLQKSMLLQWEDHATGFLQLHANGTIMVIR